MLDNQSKLNQLDIIVQIKILLQATYSLVSVHAPNPITNSQTKNSLGNNILYSNT